MINKNLTSIFKIKIIQVSIIFAICLNLFFKNTSSFEDYQNSVFQEIKTFENNLNLNLKVFEEFRQINCQDKLIEKNIKFSKSFCPDVSVIMTMYNQAHCIFKGLRSIQNQSIKNIEIIIIDDCSDDNSTDVIKKYQEEDPRISLISHNKNEGEMKSRVDGIRKAKGKYLTILDGDDALIHKDILKDSLFIAQKARLDTVEFQGLLYLNGKPKQLIYDYHNKNISNFFFIF